MKYNGWTNKETWLVNLWLADSLVTDSESSMDIDSHWVREVAQDMIDGPISDFGLVKDLFDCAFARVNWEEIASHYQVKES
jgi:hypothetical protein